MIPAQNRATAVYQTGLARIVLPNSVYWRQLQHEDFAHLVHQVERGSARCSYVCQMTHRRKQRASEVYRGTLAEPLKPRLRRRIRRALLRGRPAGVIGNSPPTGVPPVPVLAPIFPDQSRVPSWRREYAEKLPLLLDHFGIKRDDPNSWHKLCLCLAVAHVPGFQVIQRRKGGRPREIALAEEAKLFERFSQLRRDGHTERNAARLLAGEIQKAGGKDIKVTGILRRMQRCSKKTKDAAAFFQGLINATDVTQNSPH